MILCVFATESRGGEPFFMQISSVPMYYNPAYTGIFPGARVRFCRQLQAPSPGAGLNAWYVSADLGDRNLPGNGGIGLIVSSDNEGVGFIRNTHLGATYSARIRLSRHVAGQVGLKATWMQKRIGWSEFMRSETLPAHYGIVPDTANAAAGTGKVSLADFGAGGLVQITNGKGCLVTVAGLSVDHLFEPVQAFSPEGALPLKRKWTGHADLIIALHCPSGYNERADATLRINPGILVQVQGGTATLQTGVNLTQYGIYFGAWYKGVYGGPANHSVALSGGYRYEVTERVILRCTYSYGKYLTGNGTNGEGVHEISLALELPGLKLFRNAGSSYRTYAQNTGSETQGSPSGF